MTLFGGEELDGLRRGQLRQMGLKNEGKRTG